MTSSPIVSTDWLADRLMDPTIKVIQVSSKKGEDAPYAMYLIHNSQPTRPENGSNAGGRL